MKKKKLLVFVVEDDKYFSFLVEHYLKSKSSHHLTMHQEYDVESFTTAEDCLEEIKIDMEELEAKLYALEDEFSKLSYCDKLCMSFINKCIEWKIYVKKTLKQS